MANRPKGYGMTAEVSNKIAAKYSDEDEQEVVSWICALVDCEPPAPGRKSTQEWMKNGEILISLINTINPDSIKKWNKGTSQAVSLLALCNKSDKGNNC